MYQIKQLDKDFYKRYLRDNIPDCICDTHAHLWTDKHILKNGQSNGTADWVHNFCAQNSMSYESMEQVYQDFFDGKKVNTLAFGWVERNVDVSLNNQYIGEQVKKHKLMGLAVSKPEWGAQKLLEEVRENNLIGLKPYPNFSPVHIPPDSVRITDMITMEQLSIANEQGWVVLLHIPRPKRLADKENMNDLLMIEKEFPNIRLIVAHIGRAYCLENIGEAFSLLSQTKKMMFDFAGHTNADVFEKTLSVFGAKRLLFGSDFPITYMRLRREHVGGNYVNFIPAGSCGDVGGDPHMKEVSGKEADAITFFIYESMAAMLRAAKKVGLKQKDINDIFYQNAADFIGW